VWHALFSAVLSSQTVIPILVILRIAGIFWGVWQQKYFLVIWFILPYLVEPRSAPSIAFYPFCMLMAFAFTDALPAVVDYFQKRDSLFRRLEFHERGWLNTILILVIVYLLVESSLFGFKLVNTSLSIADREAMAWIQKNTPENSHFLPITGVKSPEIDPFVEWFPALTERRSQTTIQGLEWLLGSKFYERYADLADVQDCKTGACLTQWSMRTGLDYQYVVIQRPGAELGLITSLEYSRDFELVYSSNGSLIYKVLYK
jgi:hypothetical protein